MMILFAWYRLVANSIYGVLFCIQKNSSSLLIFKINILSSYYDSNAIVIIVSLTKRYAGL